MPTVRNRSSVARLLVEHSERGVARTREFARLVQHALEHGFEVKFRDERTDRCR